MDWPRVKGETAKAAHRPLWPDVRADQVSWRVQLVRGATINRGRSGGCHESQNGTDSDIRLVRPELRRPAKRLSWQRANNTWGYPVSLARGGIERASTAASAVASRAARPECRNEPQSELRVTREEIRVTTNKRKRGDGPEKLTLALPLVLPPGLEPP